MNEGILEADFVGGEHVGASAEAIASKWVVMKFGGSSVSSAENWATIAGLIKNRMADGLKPVIVHSALHGVSNSLESVLQSKRDEFPLGLLRELSEQLLELADRRLLLPPFDRTAVEHALRGLRIAPLLAGYRERPPVDLGAAVDVAVAIGGAALAEAERLEELDANPVIVGPAGRGAVVADVLVRLREPDVARR